MNRLQKKCLVAAAGIHFLVVVTVLCSGFIRPSPKPDNSPVLTMIPSKLVDAAFTSGVRSAQPPPPQPQIQPQVQQPPPPQPQPKPLPQVVKPVEPVKPPEPEPPKPDDTAEPRPKPKPHTVQPNLTKVIRQKTPDTDNKEAEAQARAEAKAAERAAKRAQEERLHALRTALNTIKENAPSATIIDLPGDATEAYADYAAVVKSVYTDAWTLPDTAANDEANVKVSVTIARDGTVTDAHIVERSGDPSVDRSAQRALDRVTKLPPFPDDATDKERTYIINFNLKAKRQMLG
jgi:protein TonB